MTIQEICLATGFTHEQLRAKYRGDNMPAARYLVASKLIEQGFTYTNIAEKLNIDHSTVGHGINKVLPAIEQTRTPRSAYLMIKNFEINIQRLKEEQDFCPFVYESNVIDVSTCRTCNEPLKHPETLGGWCSEECMGK